MFSARLAEIVSLPNEVSRVIAQAEFASTVSSVFVSCTGKYFKDFARRKRKTFGSTSVPRMERP
jgi:hypothetical protein